MKFTYDHDLHIHTHLSPCSGDPNQTAERILRYAEENGLHTLCITDHYWDARLPVTASFYKGLDFEHISRIRPLPQRDGIRLLFGCETDMDADGVIGIPREHYDDFDFIIVPTTHMHMWRSAIPGGYETVEQCAAVWIKRIDTLLASDLPHHKVGLAHPTCELIFIGNQKKRTDILDAVPDSELCRLFGRAAALGVGIELNAGFTDEQAASITRIYRAARDCGCKFYIGSDAHCEKELIGAHDHVGRLLSCLDLDESDKMPMPKKSVFYS